MPFTQDRPNSRTPFFYFHPIQRGLVAMIALGVICLLMACGHGKSGPVAQQIPATQVLDYRNGWFHSATGRETIAEVARAYSRDAEFVAQLNQMRVTAVPTMGTNLYIPPTNNVAYVRERLKLINGDISQVPKIPWNHKLETPNRKELVERKMASEGLKEKISIQPIFEKDRMVADASPSLHFPGVTSKSSSRDAPAARSGKSDQANTRPKAQTPVFKKDESFLWPVSGEIVTRFQERRCRGIEIAATEQSPVKAARSGIVLLAQDCPAYGNLVLIDHGDGYASVYGYNATITVKENDWVKSGQQIASVGRPSRGAPSKLFFQIRRNAKPVDPMEFLN